MCVTQRERDVSDHDSDVMCDDSRRCGQTDERPARALLPMPWNAEACPCNVPVMALGAAFAHRNLCPCRDEVKECADYML